MAYADDKFYIFEYNDDSFYIEFETESESESESESVSTENFDFYQSLEENYNTVEVDITGNIKELAGHTLTIPDTWTVTDANCIAPDNKNVVTFSTPTAVDPSNKEFILQSLCETYINMGFENFKFGNLLANGKEAYFIEGEYLTAHTYIFIFFNDTDEQVCLSIVTSEDPNSDEYMNALGIAASLEFK